MLWPSEKLCLNFFSYIRLQKIRVASFGILIFLAKYSGLKYEKKCNFGKLHYLPQIPKLTFFDDFPMPWLYAPGPTLAAVCGLIAREEPSLTPKAPPADLGLG